LNDLFNIRGKHLLSFTATFTSAAQVIHKSRSANSTANRPETYFSEVERIGRSLSVRSGKFCGAERINSAVGTCLGALQSIAGSGICRRVSFFMTWACAAFTFVICTRCGAIETALKLVKGQILRSQCGRNSDDKQINQKMNEKIV
jgi:hypothetical protein